MYQGLDGNHQTVYVARDFFEPGIEFLILPHLPLLAQHVSRRRNHFGIANPTECTREVFITWSLV
jgi:hypothetical protein